MQRLQRFLDPPSLRAALWALRALLHARSQLRRRQVVEISLPAPPALNDGAERGVHALLRRSHSTCLERALVRQAWERAHGRSRAVVIGVNGDRTVFAAHAWLEGDPPVVSDGYTELIRV